MRIHTVLCFAAMALAPAVSQAAPSAPRSAMSAPTAGTASAAAAEFIDAFNALDRSRFDPLFAEDVTLFFPSAPFDVRRVEGRQEVLKWFGKFFDAARKRTAKMNIRPVDLHVQDYGAVAIVTFHLNGGDDIGRRTLAMRKDSGGWKIVHLHASAQPLKKAG